MQAYKSIVLESIRSQVAQYQNHQVTTQEIIERMEKSKQMMGRREFDKSRPIELTQSQLDTIAKNKGIHIYGKSHPLYKG